MILSEGICTDVPITIIAMMIPIWAGNEPDGSGTGRQD